MPACPPRDLSRDSVLAFARALGEYGATSMLIGYVPGKDCHYIHYSLSALEDK